MKRLLLLPVCLLLYCNAFSQKWRMAPAPLYSPWAAEVNPEKPWPEYPRPELVRKQWKNLNGLWEYAISGKQDGRPDQWTGKILVPYPVESALSGVQRSVDAKQKLRYRTLFKIPASWKKKRVLLHFEAVDWECRVWVNGQDAGFHRGGYTPFEFDISGWLKSGDNELIVSVSDPTDTGWQPLGKQTLTPGGIFYTAVTGIWQTVWLEPVPEGFISDYRVVTDIDRGQVQITPLAQLQQPGDRVEVLISFAGKPVAKADADAGQSLTIPVPEARLWAPGDPQLYDLKLRLRRGKRIVDEVTGYFGMRKVALGKDVDGFTKILINNHFVFQNGPLDQGFWPEGIYTPPTEEAMRYDLEMIRNMGFNMLRKHVKVESRRFYYWCDRMGLLVWQDMPNGDAKIDPEQPDIQRSRESATQFEFELKSLIDSRCNHPSIIMWVPFNEGWGQYETERIARRVWELDPTRLVNNASGWADRKTGDVLDWHHYPDPVCPPAEDRRAIVLGEFGGLGLKTEGHMWEEKNWGYSTFFDREAMISEYEKYYGVIWNEFLKKGLSACVYTQITDVETEANGLMTYDRRVVKADPAVLKAINTGQFVPAPVITPFGGLFNTGDSITLQAKPGMEIRYTLDGSEPGPASMLYRGGIRLTQDVALRARAFEGEKSSRAVTAAFTLTAQPRPTYVNPYHPKYRAANDFALIDGLQGGDSFADGRWQGFRGNDLDVLISLPETTNLHSVSIRFLENTGAWIFLPQQVTVSYSMNGRDFEKAGEVIWATPAENRTQRVETAEINLPGKPVKYLKIQAKNTGECPAWHPGKGQPCWLFTDEIQFQ